MSLRFLILLLVFGGAVSIAIGARLSLEHRKNGLVRFCEGCAAAIFMGVLLWAVAGGLMMVSS